MTAPSLQENKPNIAVLISTYKPNRFLSEQIDSILQQEGVDVTIFIRDDGTPTKDQSIYSQLPQKNINISFESNIGPAQSFLKLLRDTPKTFDYYSFADQDDVWLPKKLKAASEQLGQMDSSIASLYCGALTITDETLRPIRTQRVSSTYTNMTYALFHNYATGNTMVFNKTATTALKPYLNETEIIMHDWWLLLALLSENGHCIYDTNSYVLYRQHERNHLGMTSSWKQYAHLAKCSTGKHTIQTLLYQLKTLKKCNRLWVSSPWNKGMLYLLQNDKTLWQRLKCITKRPIKSRSAIRTIYLSIFFIVWGNTHQL